MNSLLQQFILEARDFLQSIGEKLLALEGDSDNAELIAELFRLVHTLKGNSGLFEFPEMTRVLHAMEDLMDAVRDGRVAYSQQLADRLLEAMDFVGLLLDEVEADGTIHSRHAGPSAELAQSLRALIVPRAEDGKATAAASAPAPAADRANSLIAETAQLAAIPETVRISAYRAAAAGAPLFWVDYRPEEECFFKGEDPFHMARQAPGIVWGNVVPRAPWPPLSDLDCYRCQLDFHLLVIAKRDELDYFFRYTPEQVTIRPVAPLSLVVPDGLPNGGPVYGDFVAEALGLLEAGDLDGLENAARALLELSAPELWTSSALRWLLVILEVTPGEHCVLRTLIESFNTLTPPDWASMPMMTRSSEQRAIAVQQASAPSVTQLSAEDYSRLEAILTAQAEILALPDTGDWLLGRLKAVAGTLSACLPALGESSEEVAEALAQALAERSARPLRQWLAAYREGAASERADTPTTVQPLAAPVAVAAPSTPAVDQRKTSVSDESGFGRRAEDGQTTKVLRVDQSKVDRLMDLIGEMVVAKNSLPYLANRAENQYGVRELAREIKAQYAVINRIAEEMQDAIMQVRMMPVSFVFQRFPRLVRDVSRKLGKEVDLVFEGEDTEADKNIIEALADPLIHIVRNSLDHGVEPPEERVAAGKPRAGRLLIRALQEFDRVLIEVSDDGRGIDPAIVKRKAYEKGIIDEDALERITDQEAIHLVFVPGFSTAEAVSDLSGRGVGMDVVRSTVEKLGGTVQLISEVGRGTTLKLSLPLSMAVTNVMIIESDRQIFGVPMDDVVETVRVPRTAIRMIKRQKTTVLRGRIVPLVALNDLLAVPAEPRTNADDEFAVLVVRVAGEPVGLLVDDFREVVDVILKPLPGDLAKLSCYAGTALLGDGSVLMVLNPKELF